MEAYVHGVSTRSVDDLVVALGAGSGSPSPRSPGSARGWTRSSARSAPGRWTTSSSPTSTSTRPTSTSATPRQGAAGQVISMAVVVATGITADGVREILGLDVGDSEDEVFWRGFLHQPQATRPGRGAAGHLRPARRPGRGAAAVLPGRGAPAVPGPLRPQPARPRPQGPADMVAAVFRTIFAQPDAAGVEATWDKVRDQLAARFPKIGPLMDDAKAEVLAFTAFPRRTGARSGPPTRSSGSTRRSSAEPASWGSSPTPPPSSASSAPS